MRPLHWVGSLSLCCVITSFAEWACECSTIVRRYDIDYMVVFRVVVGAIVSRPHVIRQQTQLPMSLVRLHCRGRIYPSHMHWLRQSISLLYDWRPRAITNRPYTWLVHWRLVG